jgi:hypothetical protein
MPVVVMDGGCSGEGQDHENLGLTCAGPSAEAEIETSSDAVSPFPLGRTCMLPHFMLVL